MVISAIKVNFKKSLQEFNREQSHIEMQILAIWWDSFPHWVVTCFPTSLSQGVLVKFLASAKLYKLLYVSWPFVDIVNLQMTRVF